MENLKLYAILNIDNPMVAWEVAIGRITTMTPKDSHGETFPIPSLWLYNTVFSSHKDNYFGDLRSEFQIDHVRAVLFEEKPSRLKGAFFFETYDDAVSACKYWGWDTCIDYISEIEFKSFATAKYDSNWITNKIRCCQPNERSEYIRKYFSGESQSANPIWEIIAYGYGKILNVELRRMAYNKILTDHPNSLILLAMAVMCFHQDPEKYGNLLRTMPYVRAWEGVLHGEFILNLIEYEKYADEILEIIKRLSNKNLSEFTIPELGEPFKIIAPDNETGTPSTLNLSAYKFQMSLDFMQGHMDRAVSDLKS